MKVETWLQNIILSNNVILYNKKGCKKYSLEIYEQIIDWFKMLPLAAIVDNKYFCVHGGISPSFINLGNLFFENRLITKTKKECLNSLKRNFVWSDVEWSDWWWW